MTKIVSLSLPTEGGHIENCQSELVEDLMAVIVYPVLSRSAGLAAAFIVTSFIKVVGTITLKNH